ncbi:MAG: UDP-N-acetylglucosamine 2-epimerase [Burkholderiales bacterium]|nr:GDP/UDP-N,N'-diacetylbacillosamine 2-epimerase (hydrolyzing) [Rhodocyclaceae bacterium]MCZ2175319.1 UDP-N-acetylglucosamine 2-epimerase [Burkholderiales bacterium]MCZ2420987.1 UDP-N-acetylglucosamine 2-epimerase [Burkholderiales bacterium]
MKRRISVVTGSRAEYGLLYWLMKEIQASPALELQVVATGMHLSPEFGLTFRNIEEDGFRIDEKVEMLLSSDTPAGIAKSIGLGTIGFADAFARLKPDIVLLLGDRFEIFAAAQAALVARIPLAHLHGGETTEGAIDEAFRHAITKMAHLHFTATEEYRQRVIQLGEEPTRVFNFGAAAIDGIRNQKLLGRPELEQALGFSFGERNLLVTFHPVTLEPDTAGQQFGELLAALDDLPEVRLIFTMPNADTGGRVIRSMIEGYVAAHPGRATAFDSLGQLRYFSVMGQVDAVVGNSSSGLIEAPSFHIGTINIGDRQKGRAKAASVMDCEPTRKSIGEALVRLYSDDFRASLGTVANPYGEGPVAHRIAEVLATYPIEGILKKKFFSLTVTEEVSRDQ